MLFFIIALTLKALEMKNVQVSFIVWTKAPAGLWWWRKLKSAMKFGKPF
jgi:hypothetical protein